MRYTRRELYLAGFAAVMTVAALVLLGFVLRGNGRHEAARSTAIATIAPPSGTASARAASARPNPHPLTAGYTITGRWKDGFNAELVVTNLGSQPVAGWTVKLQMPADVDVTGAWSADATQVASAVTLRAQPWNTYLGPGGTVHFGFQAKGNAAKPNGCTVNDGPC
jgi:cellulase/cellobiase CelA1